MILACLIGLYRLTRCGCVSLDSCCYQGIFAARTLPARQAVTRVLQIAGDCQHEHPFR